MSTPNPIPTSPIPTSAIAITGQNYVCPECGAKHPGKFSLGEHRARFHGIPNDWVKRKVGFPAGRRRPPKLKAKAVKANGHAPIANSEVRFLHGGFKCPECGQKFPQRNSLGVHRASRHAVVGTSKAAIGERARAVAHRIPGQILTSEVKAVRGMFPCPECGEKYTTKPNLGYHRGQAHGIAGQYAFRRKNKQKKAALALTLTSAHKPNGAHHERESRTAVEVAAQPNSPHGEAREWSRENLAGFIFAHIHTLIEDACAGRPDAIPHVTLRLSELLHLEVSGQAARGGHLGLLRRLP